MPAGASAESQPVAPTIPIALTSERMPSLVTSSSNDLRVRFPVARTQGGRQAHTLADLAGFDAPVTVTGSRPLPSLTDGRGILEDRPVVDVQRTSGHDSAETTVRRGQYRGICASGVGRPGWTRRGLRSEFRAATKW